MEGGLQFNKIIMNKIYNYISGRIKIQDSSDFLPKFNPVNGEIQCYFIDSDKSDLTDAYNSSTYASNLIEKLSLPQRGDLLFKTVLKMEDMKSELINLIHLETGKSLKDAEGEFYAALNQGKYWASEGMRYFTNVLQSNNALKRTYCLRMPLGVVGLIVPANTPLANIAWKFFPSFLCGNSSILKSSEDAPQIANLFAEIVSETIKIDGALNVLHGSGSKIGNMIVEHVGIKLISFTGSTNVGREISQKTSMLLKRQSLELGGKNPIILCEDSNIELAVNWIYLSSFSNAGQRCAAASLVYISEGIYEKVIEKIKTRMQSLKMGHEDHAHLGPVINRKQKKNILECIGNAQKRGASLITNNELLKIQEFSPGYYVAPTFILDLPKDDELVNIELFGPVALIYKFKTKEEVLDLCNNNNFGLTSAVHTQNIDLAHYFINNLRYGVVNINGGTFGSEAHFPFGGFRYSGNGTREPGLDAINVYSELKTVSILNHE